MEKMLSELLPLSKAVGIKQTQRAILEGRAQAVFYADDASLALTDRIRALCQKAGVPAHPVKTMKALGKACGIDVGAAAAAVLK